VVSVEATLVDFLLLWRTLGLQLSWAYWHSLTDSHWSSVEYSAWSATGYTVQPWGSQWVAHRHPGLGQ
jgi:hypothetical protein